MPTQSKITYTFNAPSEIVFKAFTEPDQLQNWWGPKGWAFTVLKSDFRQDGVFHYSQKPADGDEMWVKFVYNEIVAPKKLVYTNFFSDKEGNTMSAPFDENWPLETLNTVTFIEEDGKTTLTFIVAPVSPSAEEIKAFEDSQEIIQIGFTGTFDQLAEYLTER